MKNKNKTAAVFFILSLVFALVSIPYSAALNGGKMERTASAFVADDENGILKLTGFNNKYYDLNSTYTSVGSITNNTSQNLKLTVTICPEFSLNHIFSKFGIKLGTTKYEFKMSNSNPCEVALDLSSGQTVDVTAYLTQNYFGPLKIAFKISAVDSTGACSIQINDTDSTPRRIICN